MKLSLVIPVFNGLEYLKLLLQSVRKYSSEEHEVVVYDDGSADGTSALLRSLEGVMVGQSSSNQGICTAVNRAVEMATGDYVFLLNSDHVLSPNWDVALMPWLSERRVISASCIEPGIVPVASFFVKHDCGRSWQDFRWEDFERVAAKVARSEAVPGVNHPFVISKTLWEKVGGLDERFNPGPASDPDLFYRLFFEGTLMMRAQNVVLYHFSGKSSRMANESCVELPGWRTETERCNRLFIEKWGEYYCYKFGGLPQPGSAARAHYERLTAQRDTRELPPQACRNRSPVHCQRL